MNRSFTATRLIVSILFGMAAIASSLMSGTPAKANPSFGTITINVIEIEQTGTLYLNVPSSTDYVADTLCNEWLCSWRDHALYAGSVLIRSAAFWEMSRRWDTSENCHAREVPGHGYFDTQSSYLPGDDTDERYIRGSAVDKFGRKPLSIIGGVPDWHAHYNNDFIYTDYGSVIQNQTNDLAATQDWQQIIHTIYDGRYTGTCNDFHNLTPSIVLSQS